MRLALMVTAATVGIGLATYPYTLGSPSELITGLAVLALIALVGALVSSSGLVAIVAGGILALEYAASLYQGSIQLDLLSPFVGVALLLLLELLDIAASLKGNARFDPTVPLARLKTLGLMSATGGIVAWIALLAAEAVASNGFLLVIGALCGGTAIALLLPLAGHSIRARENTK
jgi:hypothetical protein